MKIIITVFIAITSMTVFAQSAKFNDAMTKAITEMDSAKTAEQFLAVANKFERIALAEKNQWLPYYYSALSRTTATFISQNTSEIDAILDVAQKHINVADSLMPNNSEIVLMKGMILGGRIMVDPMSRGMQFGMQSSMLTSQAMTLDPNNPRSYLMMGQSLFYTPEQFGGGKEKGCVQLQIAKEKF
ncbi:MAG: hypothetical protein H7Y00_13835, partial [Fimbriimonadaceae bacterium]|nr:hypothetical protein [Chitinophagales bacterium]